MNNHSIRLIRRINEKELASAIACGAREAHGDIIAWTDYDLGIPPEFVPKLVEKLYKYDIAIGVIQCE